jgi:putative (di)nucleoside polyphosphate hydrolase
MASPHFRAGVVIVVRGSDGRLLAFERGDVPGQWQAPQGGLDKDELPLDAAWRELGEETGLGPKDVSYQAEYADWVLYEYPASIKRSKGRLGQVHRWFLFDAVRADIEPKPDMLEFVAWKWVTPHWLIENAVDFRRAGYELVLGSW